MILALKENMRRALGPLPFPLRLHGVMLSLGLLVSDKLSASENTLVTADMDSLIHRRLGVSRRQHRLRGRVVCFGATRCRRLAAQAAPPEHWKGFKNVQ